MTKKLAGGTREYWKEEIQKYKKGIAYISSPEVQKKIISLLKNFENIDISAFINIRRYIEQNALEQHFKNPEQYVSHGFDHSLNVLQHLQNTLQQNPNIIDIVSKKYKISKEESILILKLLPVFHDFGYPELEKNGKTLGKSTHALKGAEIATSQEFTESVKQIMGKEGDINKLLIDFRNAILFHSADKIEVLRDTKIIFPLVGEFIK